MQIIRSWRIQMGKTIKEKPKKLNTGAQSIANTTPNQTGNVVNQNQTHNSKKVGLGPNTNR